MNYEYQKETISIMLFAILILTLVLSGCGNSVTSNEDSASTDSVSSFPKMTITLATVEANDRNTTMGAKKFKKIVESKSNGRIEVQVFPNLELGSMREQAEMVQTGAIQMTISPVSTVSSFVDDLHALELPFLFQNEKQVWKTMDGKTGKIVLNTMNDSGLKGLGIWAGGFKEITSNKPIHSPSDLRGKKVRVIPSKVLISTYKAWGANPVDIDLTELYSALQQGTADAEENPVVTINSSKLYEVQKYLTMTDHAYQFHIFMANDRWFSGLPSNVKTLLENAEEKANKYARNINIKQSKENISILKSKGMKINELDNREIEKFKRMSSQLYSKIADTDGKKKIVHSIERQKNPNK